jgi:hypothetical protein
VPDNGDHALPGNRGRAAVHTRCRSAPSCRGRAGPNSRGRPATPRRAGRTPQCRGRCTRNRRGCWGRRGPGRCRPGVVRRYVSYDPVCHLGERVYSRGPVNPRCRGRGRPRQVSSAGCTGGRSPGSR